MSVKLFFTLKIYLNFNTLFGLINDDNELSTLVSHLSTGTKT